MGELTLYIDWMSQPSRTLIIFCKMNNIPFTIKETRIMKMEHKGEEFVEKVNPAGQVPAITDKLEDGSIFALGECFAII